MPRSYRSGLATGIVISLVAVALAPLWRPAAARYGRQAAKAAIKQGIAAYELSRDRLAELSETMSDVLAEAEVERAATQQGPSEGD